MKGFIKKDQIIAEVEVICELYSWDFFCDAIMSDAKTFLDFLVQKGKI